MQIKLFTMPVFGGEHVEEELNKFLRSHRVLQLERHFFRDLKYRLEEKRYNRYARRYVGRKKQPGGAKKQ